VRDRFTRPRQHACGWPGCTREVGPKHWGCVQHFMRLPQPRRDQTWAAFRAGDAAALAETQEWIRRHGGEA